MKRCIIECDECMHPILNHPNRYKGKDLCNRCLRKIQNLEDDEELLNENE